MPRLDGSDKKSGIRSQARCVDKLQHTGDRTHALLRSVQILENKSAFDVVTRLLAKLQQMSVVREIVAFKKSVKLLCELDLQSFPTRLT